MIEAVIFDVDGVLFDSFESNLLFFQRLMKKTGYPSPTAEQFTSLFHLSMRDAIKVLTNGASDAEIERIWQIGATREDYPSEQLRLSPGAKSVIEGLHREYKLGIVTSRIRSSVFEERELALLRNHFSATITYEDTKQHKPSPEPLLLAAQQLRVLPTNAVYVGDVENDLNAARAAGMKFILFSKERLGSPDANVSTFAELPAAIAKL